MNYSVNKSIFPLLTVAAAAAFTGFKINENESASKARKPNVIFILADDLGIGDLGCYGQEKIQTPNIDRMAEKGMLFTQAYSGAPVCAPSRSTLMTGMHTGHTPIRGNKETKPEGQVPIPADAFTIAELMKQNGYATGAFGKWGMGMAGTEGDPNKQGFDEFFGYLCQRYAHRYYADYIWDNGKQYFLEGNNKINKVTYAPDLIHSRTLEFIKKNKDNSFFLFVPSVIPHAELIAPNDSLLQKYLGKFEETPWGLNSTKPYSGNDYGTDNYSPEGYCPQMAPRATFAAMVSRLDLQVGEILALLKELGIEKNTLVIFTSDNGPHQEGGADPDFFNSNGPYTGYKRDITEGGIHAPMIAFWPGKIKAGTTTDIVTAFWDMMPTFAEIAGTKAPENTDGISFLPTLTGKGEQKLHEYLYWEFYEKGGRLALRMGEWKLVRNNALKPEITTELYNLKEDQGEANNLAEKNPEMVQKMLQIMEDAHTPNADYKLK